MPGSTPKPARPKSSGAVSDLPCVSQIRNQDRLGLRHLRFRINLTSQTDPKTLYLAMRRATRRPMKARRSKDWISGKTHISERSENARAEAGHWEGDLIICKRARPVLVLYERKTKITFMARLAGKTAAETVSVIMAIFKRLSAPMARLDHLR